ncbi:hypothetical protein C1H46_031353 [Malus baccata]|uniref:N-acetyl-D-glucosamine kinase n=1 Tax=Malus baccata TaxID=106549 RepID=A0A540LA30_MALBA|nr:hypothetical protein C1H46_031353 [Malus baccata]
MAKSGTLSTKCQWPPAPEMLYWVWTAEPPPPSAFACPFCPSPIPSPTRFPSSLELSLAAPTTTALAFFTQLGSLSGEIVEAAARETLEQVMAEALAKSGSNRSAVRAVCLAVSGVNHPTDQQRILDWMRDIFPSHVRLYVQNDAVAALACGTLGKLHGCVLIAGTGTIAYGFTEDGREARAAGAGPTLGDWGSGYGIAAQALTAVVRANDGRGPDTKLTSSIVEELGLSSPDKLIGWTYADPSWARIAALVPVVVSCAEAGDEVANNILFDSVQELGLSVKAVVQRLGLCGPEGKDSFPLVMVGGVLEANKGWDIGKEVIKCISKDYPGAVPIRPKVEPAVGAALLAWNFYMNESLKEAFKS